jgi:hypothetical protein
MVTARQSVQGDADDCEYLALSFSPLSASLRSRWRNNGLSADFLGDYVTTFLPAAEETQGGRMKTNEIRHAVAFIANEFLENAMKYHDRDVSVPIGIRLELKSDQITVHASNGISADQIARYKLFIEHLQVQDAANLIVKQLEASAHDPESAESCMGLLTMMNDYGARLEWSFEADPVYGGAMTVTTSAVLAFTSATGVTA